VTRQHKEVTWVTQSIEYAALCEQTYRMAWPVLKASVVRSKQACAVVFDIDETVLDNSGYQLERAAIDSGFTPQSWQAWVERRLATPVPGVKSMLDSIRTLGSGVHIAFISDRMSSSDQATTANLRAYALYRQGDILLTRKNGTDDKVFRRNELTSGTGRCAAYGPLTIIALFGDSIRDFLPVQGKEEARKYREETLARDGNWGMHYFILPNPMYGAWENGYR
jgi:5'-nucleotidase (lipoprotein e(P4) family)